MDKGNLDIQDRRNLYREDADNVRVIEASVGEIADLAEMDIDPEMIDALDETASQVRVRTTKIAYVVIKITG